MHHLIAGKSEVTDLEFLINLGYQDDKVKKALSITNGDRKAALYLLRKDTSSDEDLTWRAETPDDWISGVNKIGLPNSSTSRALHKSPIYMRITYFKAFANGADYWFIVNVTLKNGLKWHIQKTYSEFLYFRKSLPLGTCFHFKNNFPLPAAMQLVFGSPSQEFLNARMDALNEWLRELCLNEKCMRSPIVLNLLMEFVEAEEHQYAEKKKDPLVTSKPGDDHGMSTLGRGKVKSPLLTEMSKNLIIPTKKTYWTSLPVFNEVNLPLTLDSLQGLLPLRVDVKKLPSFKAFKQAEERRQKKLAETTSSNAADKFNTNTRDEPTDCSIRRAADVDWKQLGKDMGRDRLVVQGKRIQGSMTSLDDIVKDCRAAVTRVIEESGCQLPPWEAGGSKRVEEIERALEAFVVFVLSKISRTESASSSHSGLMDIVDMENKRQSPDFCPYLVVPESTLADPLSLQFRVQRKKEFTSCSVAVAAPVAEAERVMTGSNLHHSTIDPAVVLPSGDAGASRVRAVGESGDEWCVSCEGKASTVFRLLEPISMKPILQLKVHYICTCFGLPFGPCWGEGLGGGLRVREGKQNLIVSRETTTSSRDWSEDSYF